MDMTLLRAGLAALLLVISLPAWCQAPSTATTEVDAKAPQLLGDGTRLMQAKKPAEAIRYFDNVIASYESRYKDKNVRYYSPRSLTEQLYYMVDAANNNKGSAMAVSANWGYAHYLKGYVLLDLGRAQDAKVQLERAVTLSPQNSQFLNDLGHVYQVEKNWKSALETFQRAEKAAKEFAPPNVSNAELGRAWRGTGYVLVELNRLDDAEATYRKCLELDSNDVATLRELQFVQGVKAAKPK